MAHHRQKAVEARLELQEMKGMYKTNGSIGHSKIILTSKFTHTHTQSRFFIKGSSSLRASRLRRSAKLEEEKKIEERNFTMPTKEKIEEKNVSAYDGPSEEELRKLEKDLESQKCSYKASTKRTRK